MEEMYGKKFNDLITKYIIIYLLKNSVKINSDYIKKETGIKIGDLDKNHLLIIEHFAELFNNISPIPKINSEEILTFLEKKLELKGGSYFMDKYQKYTSKIDTLTEILNDGKN
jgi:hypothetical protein